MKHHHRLNQNGLVSIISTVLIIIIITIVTLSLSVFSRRELRQALDEQLSSQALYAAESGINDAVNRLTATTPDRLTSDVSGCSDLEQDKISTDRTLQTDSNVRYTCVLVDQSPDAINTDVSTNRLKTYLLDPGASQQIKDLTFTWKNTNSSSADVTDCSTPPNCFVQDTPSYNRLGVLRVRLLPVDATTFSNSFSSGNVIDAIGFPGGPVADTLSVSPTTKSKYLYASCEPVNYTCTIKITNLNSLGVNKHYVQISSLYKDINVTVKGANVSVSDPVTQFIGAQVSIDSTGAAGDVYKRLSVTIPLGESSSLPVYTLGVGDKLCKRFESSSTGTTNAIDATNCLAFE